MLAMGARVNDVAAELAVTRETVTEWQRDAAVAIDAASDARVEGVVEGAARAKRVLIENGERLAQTLVDAADGNLTMKVDGFEVEADAAMTRVRGDMAAKALAFIIATKSETDIGSSALESVVVAMRHAIKARR